MISPKLCHCIHHQYMSKYVTVSTTNTWDTRYVTVFNTWAKKDTMTSYCTQYTLCTALISSMYKKWILSQRSQLKEDRWFFVLGFLSTAFYRYSLIKQVNTGQKIRTSSNYCRSLTACVRNIFLWSWQKIRVEKQMFFFCNFKHSMPRSILPLLCRRR